MQLLLNEDMNSVIMPIFHLRKPKVTNMRNGKNLHLNQTRSKFLKRSFVLIVEKKVPLLLKRFHILPL